MYNDEYLPTITTRIWTTPLQPEETTIVHDITSKPHNHTIFTVIGKVQLRWSKLHCLRPFYPNAALESYYLNDDIITATLHIVTANLNSDHQLHIWTRDPGFYNSIMHFDPGGNRQEALTSAAKQLSTVINGVTAFDHNWLLFPQHIRQNHWTMLAVDVPTARIHWLDSLSSHDNDHIAFQNRTKIITSVLTSAWSMTYHSPSPKWESLYRTDVPQQQNNIDCGLYTIATSLQLITGQPLRFSPREASRLRYRLALILAGAKPDKPRYTDDLVDGEGEGKGDQGEGKGDG
jgi:hypothetical protein